MTALTWTELVDGPAWKMHSMKITGRTYESGHTAAAKLINAAERSGLAYSVFMRGNLKGDWSLGIVIGPVRVGSPSLELVTGSTEYGVKPYRSQNGNLHGDPRRLLPMFKAILSESRKADSDDCLAGTQGVLI